MTDISTHPVVDYSPPTARGGFGTQTWGLLVDAYRDLHSRRLFWITLVLSILVPLVFLLVGINQTGITIAGKEIPGAWNSRIIPAAEFYRFLLVAGAIPIWLGFFAAVLAGISVGGIFPDMLTGGSIDLYLSKPISRVRLFLTKYIFALLFVAMQVLAFSAAAFVVMAVRGGVWDARLFLAVPLVVLFFSYLYCFCVLIGIVTRSTLAAILVTALFWGMLFALNAADEILLSVSTAADRRLQTLRRMVNANEQIIARNAALPPEQRSDVNQIEFQRDKQRTSLAEAVQSATTLRWWSDLIVSVRAPLPKTNETVDLMKRWLVNPESIYAVHEEEEAQRRQRRAERGVPAPPTRPVEDLEGHFDAPETQLRIETTLRSRSLGWVVGTSLGFEAVVLALAAWIFSRRDF